MTPAEAVEISDLRRRLRLASRSLVLDGAPALANDEQKKKLIVMSHSEGWAILKAQIKELIYDKANAQAQELDGYSGRLVKKSMERLGGEMAGLTFVVNLMDKIESGEFMDQQEPRLGQEPDGEGGT